MPLRIDERAAEVALDDASRAAFARDHYLRLPVFLAPALVERVRARLDDRLFVETRHGAIASTDLRLRPSAASELLVLVCNDPSLLAAVASLVGEPAIGRLNGSIYRMRPGAGHEHDWHDDYTDGRRAAISINLGTREAEYDGGTLQLRERARGRLLAEVPNPRPGDAVLFRLDPALQHRVTPVTAGQKTAFSGWFRAGASLVDDLRRATGSAS